MNKYESVFITDSEKNEEQVAAITEAIKEIVEKEGGALEQVEYWGKKKLAYTVKKQKYGYYTLLLFTGSGGLVEKIERFMRHNESVIKYITLTHDPRSSLRPSTADPSAGSFGRYPRRDK